MRKLFLILLVVFATCLLASAFRIPVTTGEVDVPVVLKMSELLEMVPEDFDANWQGIRVAFDGLYVPFQIEDADDNNRISAGDYLVFLAKGNGEIIIPEEDIESVKFEPFFVLEKADGNWKITAKDNLLSLSVNDHGLAQVTMFNGVEATLLDEIGIARVSGWPESRFPSAVAYRENPHKGTSLSEIISTDLIWAGRVKNTWDRTFTKFSTSSPLSPPILVLISDGNEEISPSMNFLMSSKGKKQALYVLSTLSFSFLEIIAALNMCSKCSASWVMNLSLLASIPYPLP